MVPSGNNLLSRVLLLLLLAFVSGCDEPYVRDGKAFLIESPEGDRTLRVSFYPGAVRVQTAHGDEGFLPDDHYEMVVRHDSLMDPADVKHSGSVLAFGGVTVDLDTLAVSFTHDGQGSPLLYEQAGAERDGDIRRVRFRHHHRERFTGLGHGYFARADSLDLSGQVIERNYGREQIEQAPLIVPFFLSSRGYGVFLNSTFPNRFAFTDDDFSIAIDTHGFDGRMDYFFVSGPTMADVLENYIGLTGRPRLPPKSIFGLQLSDKGHDHNSATPSDEDWWKAKITEHREAGLPVDHVVNDNRWRAAGGQRCVSKLDWDPDRYPDPAEWAAWLAENGLTSTLDFNRCIAQFSDGWKPDFNLPEGIEVDFAESAPDLTNPEFRRWFWNLFYTKSLDPALGFPGDALWIDEFDEQGAMPLDTILANGRSSAEMRNYWFFLIAKALVADGWDQSDIDKRPYVWVRGMTAGAQRYATLWSGDIKPNNEDFAAQVRAMQLAGLSGFPFWGHDAGGFFDWDEEVGPDESLYMRWAMAFGSFAPIWKPHGMGQSRWPLDRSEAEQRAAHKFGRLRYELMPYLYSAARRAANPGIPIARPMLLEYPDRDEAWEHDLQYLWGPDILVAPNTTDEQSIPVWLPPGDWYHYGTHRRERGDRVVDAAAAPGTLPLYVRAGAIIPRREYAQSTFFIDETRLILDVYVGADGTTFLLEDDHHRDFADVRGTRIKFEDKTGTLIVRQSERPSESPAPRRDIVVYVYGLGEPGAAPRRFAYDDVPMDQALTVEIR